MIKEMFTGVSTWPALILAPILICLVLGFYYFESYQTCTEKSELRGRFINLAQQASEAGIVFDVATSTDFSWDTLKVINAFKTDTKYTPNCLFNWDWSKTHREQLSAQKRLTMLVFINEGRIVKYLELDKQVLDLENLHGSYNSAEAYFNIRRGTTTSSLLMTKHKE